MLVRLLAAVTLVGAAGAVTAADLPANFAAREFANADGTKSPYVVYVPPGYDGKTAVPVVLFLHGSGESKGGAKQPIEQGLGNGHITKRAKTFPAIVVIPQCENRRTGWVAGSPDGKRALAILDATMKEYKIDPDRQYLTGLSMGGYGTWSLAAAHPDRWAAIAPVCGRGDPGTADKFKGIPCWCWHGDADTSVKVDGSRQMVAALKAAGGSPRYTELAHVGHNSWDAAYATDDLYTWLFAQRRGEAK